MNTTLILTVALALPSGFVFGWFVGYMIGKDDGAAEYEEYSKRKRIYLGE